MFWCQVTSRWLFTSFVSGYNVVADQCALYIYLISKLCTTLCTCLYCMYGLLPAGGCDPHHPHSVITAIYDGIKQHTHSISPSLNFTRAHTFIAAVCPLAVWLLPSGLWLLSVLWRKWLMETHAQTHLCSPWLSPSFFFIFSSSFFSLSQLSFLW